MPLAPKVNVNFPRLSLTARPHGRNQRGARQLLEKIYATCGEVGERDSILSAATYAPTFPRWRNASVTSVQTPSASLASSASARGRPALKRRSRHYRIVGYNE